ncbi:MAG TPA: DUF1343 domain-containing protein [Gemmatimonadaceae bacterium]|nr:DUF1343 domain-containing protein [Gemmatimonadaceae bacterium]
MAVLGCTSRSATTSAPATGLAASAPVRPGLDQFVANPPDWARGKRLGLITNVAAIDSRGRNNIDLLAGDTRFKLTALFAFEHGLRGDAPAGQAIANGTDPKTGLPVYSLYGDVHEPTAEMLGGIDVLMYDVQDVGARPYTRVSTMALSMKAAAAKGIPFAVLDRPNPIGGTIVEGPVLDPAFASFVGMYPIPLRHGMTVGELARMYNTRFGIGATLYVVPVEGWRRDMTLDATGLRYIPPSPNLRRLEAAVLYPGTVLLEGTNISEGRGTEMPFEQTGAPWIQPNVVIREMDALHLPGVRFEAVSIPVAADGRRFPGTTIPGVRLVVTDRTRYRAVRTAMLLIDTIHRLYPNEFAWTGSNQREPTMRTVDRLAGTDRFRTAVDAGMLRPLLDEWERQAEVFRVVRGPFLLYR